MYCQVCGEKMDYTEICPVCGNDQQRIRERWLEEDTDQADESITGQVVNSGGRVAEIVLENLSCALIDWTKGKCQEKWNRKTADVTHRLLVKMKLEKKTLRDRMKDWRHT